MERTVGFAAGWAATGRAAVGFQGFTPADTAAGRIVSAYALGPLPPPAADGVTRYVNDPLGMLAEVAFGADLSSRPVQRLRFSRDALGREVWRGNGGGFALSQRFDEVGQLASQSVRGRMGHTSYDRSYAYDRAFSPMTIVDNLWGTTRYAHDGNGQVIAARHGEGAHASATQGATVAKVAPPLGFTPTGLGDESFEQERFAYDSARNVAANDTALPGEILGRPLTPWLSSLGGKVKAARGPLGESVLLTHDGCGRVTERRIERDGFRPRTWRYAWDAFDRLVGCVNLEGERWSYGYDPFGRRVDKRRQDCPARRGGWQASRIPLGMRFVWDGDVVAEEIPIITDDVLDIARRVTWHFKPGTFRPAARESRDGSGATEMRYVITDHLGTPRELIAGNGELEWAATHRLWGGVRQDWRRKPVPTFADGTLAADPDAIDTEELCPIRFQGQWADRDTDLCSNGLRH